MIFTTLRLASALALAVPSVLSARSGIAPLPVSGSTSVAEQPLSIGGNEEFRRKMLDWSAPQSSRSRSPIAPERERVLLANPLDRMRPSSPFGIRSDPIDGDARYHAGIDIPARAGTPVHAAADGVVVRSGWASGYGNLVVIRHDDGLETRYGHLSRVIATTGQAVHRDQVVGLVGETGRATGNHLHFEVRLFGKPADPQQALRGMPAPATLVVMPDEPLPPVVTHWTGWTSDADRLPAAKF